jgi:arylsulfatase A-like enzyme
MTNVVLVLMDDMRKDLLPYMPFCYGTLMPEGTEFENMRCEVPICSPARAAVLTGQHSRDSGNLVYDNTESIPNDTTDTLPLWVQGATASNGFFGKYSNNLGTVAPGWDFWRCLSAGTQEAYAYTVQKQDSSTTTPGTSGVHQLKHLQTEINSYLSSVSGPFFCYFAPTNPHINVTQFHNNPWFSTMSKFGWVKWPMEHLLSDSDAATKPTFRTQVGAQLSYSTLSAMRTEIQQQIREVYDVDTVIKSMYDTLAARGGSILSDTIWIFATDSGVHYEEQRLMGNAGVTLAGKNEPFDFISKVPCFMSGQNIPAETKVATLATLQDITATILAIFSSSATLTQRGTDLRTFITTEDPTRVSLYERQESGDATLPDATGIWTPTRALIKYVGQTSGDTYEMYDLDTDPNWYTNVANQGGRLTERNALEAQMNAIV